MEQPRAAGLRSHMTKMIGGLILLAVNRKPYQQSCVHQNLIRPYKFLFSTEVLEFIPAEEWQVGKLQIDTFESSPRKAEAEKTEKDYTVRHTELVQTLRNFMLYMGALLHVCFLACLEPLAVCTETSNFLHLSSGKLLNHVIKEISLRFY